MRSDASLAATLHRSMLGVAMPLLACALASCDPRPLPATATEELPACCGGRGTCLPDVLFEPQYAELLGRDGCDAAADSVCVPDSLRAQRAPAACRVADTRAEGRCLPECLPAVRDRADQLAVDGCKRQERCVPCYDPLTGESTGACNLPGDAGPAEEPGVFEICCQGLGRCVPASRVGSDQRSLLGSDRCDETMLCVPNEALTEPEYAPPACTVSAFGAEGRCLPACLPSLAAVRDLLREDGCEPGRLCAPCFDPFDGSDTGACGSPNDPGPRRLAVQLDDCCGGEGRCVPDELLEADVRGRLGPDTCSSARELCVPSTMLERPDQPPERCTSGLTGGEGRCLAACLPEVARQRDRLEREGCEAPERCVPCFDPLDGDSTGACESPGDPGPTQEPAVLSPCCEGLGRCVPAARLDSEQRDLLGPDECDDERLCVPTEAVVDPMYAPPDCTVSANEAEGRCLPACLPSLAARRELLETDGCEAGRLCAPCFDPLTGEATGACAFPGDPGPRSSASRLADCCGELGRCTPRAWVPEDQRPLFDDGGCEVEYEVLCVAPAEALSDAGFVPPSCHDDRTGAEGRCLPECLPQVAARASVLARGPCAAAHLCVPCFDPIRGEPTGACSTGADPGPREPAATFQACCGTGSDASGLCVPGALLPSDLPALPRQGCTDPQSVCAPRELVADASAGFERCSTTLSNRGVCIQACYVEPAMQAALMRGSCAVDWLCAPCALMQSLPGC